LRRIRERSIGGVLDHEGNADFAADMAELIDDCEEVWMVHTGFAVDGSIDWKVPDDVDDGCSFPA
jgi:hypothetical protein